MGLSERIWHWLTSSASRAPRKGHPDLYPIDVAKLTKEINLVEEAKRLGEARLPAPDAKALTGPEALIVQRVEKVRLDYTDWAVLRTQVLSQDLGKRNVAQAVNRARQADKEFERKAGGILTDRESLLRDLGQTAAKRQSELNNFKVANGLDRDAHSPYLSTFLMYALLAAAVVFEGLINAHFFAQGLSTGLIGGFKYAASLALLNIFVAFGIGKFFVRYIYHRSMLWKMVGATWIIVAVILMLIIGLGIAHMRDALTVEAIEAEKAALEALLASPFGLRDIMSWALLGISLLFASLAFLDGLFSDDLYPNYGAVSERAKSANAEYDDELEDLRAELDGLKDEHLKNLDNEVRESQTSVAVFESLIDDKEAAGSRLSRALMDADNALEALLRKFRTENELHRGDAQRPAYFDSKPELTPLPLPDFDTSNDQQTLSEQKALVNALLNEVQSLRANIEVSFNRHFDRLKPLSTQFSNTESA